MKLSRRKLLGSLGAIGVAAGGAGAGTFAYFQDSETSSGNTVEAGTVDLGLHDGGDGYTYTMLSATPDALKSGGSDRSTTINIKNSGTLRLDHLDITFSNDTVEDANGDQSSADSGPNSDPDQTHGDADEPAMSRWIYVDELTYDPPGNNSDGSSNAIELVNEGTAQSTSQGTIDASADGNAGFVSLADLESSMNQSVLSGFTPPEAGSSATAGGESSLTIAIEMHPNIPNDYQGDVLVTDIEFVVEQAGQ